MLKSVLFIFQFVLFVSAVFGQSKAIDITEIQKVLTLSSGLHILDAYEEPPRTSSMNYAFEFGTNRYLPIGNSYVLMSTYKDGVDGNKKINLYNIKTGEWWTAMYGANNNQNPGDLHALSPVQFSENILVVYIMYNNSTGGSEGALVRITGSWPDAMFSSSTSATADLDQSGKVDSLDLLAFQKQWHTSPPPATGKNITIDIPNLQTSALPLEMVLIPAGSFTMGSSPDERSRSDNEWDAHEVTLTKPFYIGRYEVTKGQWLAIIESDPSEFGGDNLNYPVDNVSWNDCQEFAQKLKELGLGTFRLPTEAEWEYACRAGTTTRFWFGDALACDDSASECAEVDSYLWWRGNISPYGTKRIGLKISNPWDLFDMHGNVSEFCQDIWEPPYDRGAQFDPTGPEQGDSRVLRGGGFSTNLAESRSAYRSAVPPSQANSSYGFRLVREYP